ncbi:MAG TPA: response regulator, partial [Flavisolibacter sp.]|nr:response regulator [Flavisolibacter sp.]
MKVIIIEDEHLSAQRLEAMLKKYDASIEVLAEIPSVAEAVQWFKENEDPDLVFMDIHLEDGQSFTIFDTINLDVPVIFTTAFDDYTIKAFKVNSVDYLMKPLNFEELVKAIEKFKRIHAEKEES